MTVAKLQVQGLTKRFGRRVAVDQLDLTVHQGEIMGFLGPNGAGKTTAIKMIMGFLFEDEGTIQIGPYDLRKNYEQAMGLVGGIVENPEMYNHFTGYQNLELYARLHGIKDRRVIERAVTMVQMEQRIHEKVKRYSLGMKQRTGLALALLHRPELLILDEPTNGLDPAGIRHLRDILKVLAHEEGVAVLVSSHLLSEMELMCDRVTVIDQGRLVDVRSLHPEETVEGMDPLEMAKRLSNWVFTIHDTSNISATIDGAFPSMSEELRERMHLEVLDPRRFRVLVTDEELRQIQLMLLRDGRTILGLQHERENLEEVYMKLTEHSRIH